MNKLIYIKKNSINSIKFLKTRHLILYNKDLMQNKGRKVSKVDRIYNCDENIHE